MIKIDITLVEVKLFNSRFISRVLFKPLPLCGIIKKSVGRRAKYGDCNSNYKDY